MAWNASVCPSGDTRGPMATVDPPRRSPRHSDGEASRLAVHHQEVDPILLPHVEHGTDVLVAESGQRLGLALEPLFQRGGGGNVRWEDFDRDGAIQPRVARLVDLAHPAGAQWRDELVGPETSTTCERHGLGLYIGGVLHDLAVEQGDASRTLIDTRQPPTA